MLFSSTCRKQPAFCKSMLSSIRPRVKHNMHMFTIETSFASKDICFICSLIQISQRNNDRRFPAENKLIGNVQLKSHMTEGEIFQEIFKTPIGYDRFTVLRTSGGDSKCLMVPVHISGQPVQLQDELRRCPFIC